MRENEESTSSIELTKTVVNTAHNYFKSLPQEAPEEVPRIHVDEIASQVASLYEKIRNVVDYREEHLLRKTFIERVLRRRLVLNAGKGVAESIIKEIIRAGHLRNDIVPETKIAEVERVVEVLKSLLRHIPTSPAAENKKISEWLHSVTASRIEDLLFPPRKDTLSSTLMFLSIKERLTIRGVNPSDEDINANLFVAIQRAFLQSDPDQLRYRLLQFAYPKWNDLTPDDAKETAEKLPEFMKKMDEWSTTSLTPYFTRLCVKYATVYHVLSDVISRMETSSEFEMVMKSEHLLEEESRAAYKERFAKEKARLKRLAIFSVVSFLISKIAVALAIEVLIENYLTHSFSLINTIINIAVPPLLMLIIVLAVKMPGSGNFELVFEEVKNVVYQGRDKKYIIDIGKLKSTAITVMIQIIYAAVFLSALWILIKTLLALGFNTANIAIFIFFVSLVSATGVKIHNRAKEMSLKKKKTVFLSFLLDLFAMPLVTLGRWLLKGLSRFNPLVVLINFLIEAPFQIFIEILEHFRAFLTSKKEEVI